MTTEEMKPQLVERLEILQVIHEWMFFRDNGNWDSLRTLFSATGRMNTNSASMTADEFIAYARDLRAKGVLSHHFMGPSIVRCRGDKALVETQAHLMLRSNIGGIEVDITCLLRYLDRLVLEDGRWKILDRQPIYIKDRLDPVRPEDALQIDEQVLKECPEGCRYLIYFSRANGAPHNPMKRATFNTTYANELYSAGQDWLKS